MITDSELRIANESYTHKDFYQIYPEILDLVNKITERWDPQSSNESDPGVVLLKLLAFIADKVNYNIDKNVLETFMPSATQAESMRKLCDMMGYDMHYYRSATTDVSFMWIGKELNLVSSGKQIIIPRFTNICDETGGTNYVLTEQITLNAKGEPVSKLCIEGEWVDLTINNGKIIKLFNLDDNRRLYLPEPIIAENGIWIWNHTDECDPDIDPMNIEKALFWSKTSNLNNVPAHSTVWKFGYDSKRRLPYILFPEDVSELIGNGLRLRYIRTSGANGNIKARTLTKLSGVENLTYIENVNSTAPVISEVPVTDGDNTYLVIQNNMYTINGCDVETLEDAYNGFKKTIGTFDTLVTCRDYANKIYNLVVSDTNLSNLVSNVQASDIRDDINFSNKVVTFNEYGLVYETFPEYKSYDSYTSFSDVPSPSSANVGKFVFVEDTKRYYQSIEISSNNYQWQIVSEDVLKTINHFDLYIYPLNPNKGLNIATEKIAGYTAKNYENTFKPNSMGLNEIKTKLTNYQTLSHNIKQISTSDNEAVEKNIYLIKNYYHLKAKIVTSYKVSSYEGDQILKNVYAALYNNFNARMVDYGEEIPFDSLLKVIEQADSRIKSVALEEPEINTFAMAGNGSEYSLSNSENGEKVYNRLLAKNVLAGKLPLFNYDTRFKYMPGQTVLENESNDIYGQERKYPFVDATTKPVVPEADMSKYSITNITTGVDIPIDRTESAGYTLNKNEIIQLIAPNLVDSFAYPAYTNYFFISHEHAAYQNTPLKLTRICTRSDSANANQFVNFLNASVRLASSTQTYKEKITFESGDTDTRKKEKITTKLNQVRQQNQYYPEKAIYYTRENNPGYFVIVDPSEVDDNFYADATYYSVTPLRQNNLYILERCYGVNNCLYTKTQEMGAPGLLIDADGFLYKTITSSNFRENMEIYGKVQEDDTIGANASAPYVPANKEYKMISGDVLYINYTDSDDIVHNIAYYGAADNGYYIENNNGVQHSFSGIIRPNFDMYDSALYKTQDAGHRYAKKDGFIPSWGIEGMYALQGTQEIAFRDFVQTEIKYSPFLAYWITRNNNVLTFTATEAVEQNGVNVYKDFYYMLDNNEYFFYTDSLKTTLTTLGSGTTLKIHLTQPSTEQTISFKLLTSTDIDLDEVANEGIGAFSDMEWQNLQFSNDKSLIISVNQIITLGEGDVIRNVKFKGSDQSETKITNTWRILDATDFLYNDLSLTQFANFSNNIDWKIRSSLCLNVGPDITQTLYSDDPNVYDSPVTQWFTLSTSAWKDKMGNYIEVSAETELNDYTRELIPLGEDQVTHDIKVFSKGSLRCNYLLQELGGVDIPATRFTLDGTEKDDLLLYPFKEIIPQVYTTENTKFELNLGEDFSRISFSTIKDAALPIFIPKNTFGIMMFCYIPSSEFDPTDSEAVLPKLKSYLASSWDWDTSDTSTITPVSKDVLMFYKDVTQDPVPSYGHELDLHPGVNVIKITEGGSDVKGSICLEIARGSDDEGVILFGSLDIVNILNNDKTGINYELLGIEADETAAFLKVLQGIHGSENFYYNAPLNIYDQIDTKKFDEYSWFNYNNVCNKFVLSELDVDFSDIQIAKSSRTN